jgi:hypothetical protein
MNSKDRRGVARSKIGGSARIVGLTGQSLPIQWKSVTQHKAEPANFVALKESGLRLPAFSSHRERIWSLGQVPDIFHNLLGLQQHTTWDSQHRNF